MNSLVSFYLVLFCVNLLCFAAGSKYSILMAVFSGILAVYYWREK